MNESTIRLFQRTTSIWLVCYLFSASEAWEWLWGRPVSPPLPAPGPFALFTDLFDLFPPWLMALGGMALMIIAAYGLFMEPRTWMKFLIWSFFTSFTQRAWLASSGGQQLMENVLLWSVLLAAQPAPGWRAELSRMAFWAIRVQVIFPYAITALHKFTGTRWLNGHAMGIVASDPLFGPAWLAAHPALAACVTWAVLGLQLTLPVAVWWRRTRLAWLCMGAVFHLLTAWYLSIPDMAFAFIACYAIWLPEQLAAWPSSFLRRVLPKPRQVGVTGEGGT